MPAQCVRYEEYHLIWCSNLLVGCIVVFPVVKIMATSSGSVTFDFHYSLDKADYCIFQ